MPIALEPFDPDREFITKTTFRAGGVIHPKRTPFDKSRVNRRVLEQLYNARKIGYTTDAITARKDKRFSKVLRGFVGAISQYIEGVPGTAREAPGAEESTPALSGSASAPASDPEGTAAAAALVDAPAEEEAAADPGGDPETAAAVPPSRDDQINQLMVDHSLKQLLELASGIPGLPSKPNKLEVATALVDQRQAA